MDDDDDDTVVPFTVISNSEEDIENAVGRRLKGYICFLTDTELEMILTRLEDDSMSNSELYNHLWGMKHGRQS